MRPLPVPTRPVSRRSVDQFRQAAERARAGCAQFPLGGAAVHVGIVDALRRMPARPRLCDAAQRASGRLPRQPRQWPGRGRGRAMLQSRPLPLRACTPRSGLPRRGFRATPTPTVARSPSTGVDGRIALFQISHRRLQSGQLRRFGHQRPRQRFLRAGGWIGCGHDGDRSPQPRAAPLTVEGTRQARHRSVLFRLPRI